MRFHGVLLGNQQAMWSKQHNGKVRELQCIASRMIILLTQALKPTFKGCLQAIDILEQSSWLRADVPEKFPGKSNPCEATP
jgi:hypothetical protein